MTTRMMKWSRLLILSTKMADTLRENFEESHEKIGRNDVDVWKSDMRSKFKNDQATNGNVDNVCIMLYN